MPPAMQVVFYCPDKIASCEALLDLSKPVVVNYCDVTCCWDWTYFKPSLKKTLVQVLYPPIKDFIRTLSVRQITLTYAKQMDGWMTFRKNGPTPITTWKNMLQAAPAISPRRK
ncbi:hypothetical protein AV903_10355 [Erwinia tracheiphila]|uniref:Uncharacterized protein n=1 Tax=Erwinia tracheiphila TaxID=65700 RepID=A0A345CSE2_9GAMM|nr:hypothetical protein AV903_10355 [Erwinia tracheiphila]